MFSQIWWVRSAQAQTDANATGKSASETAKGGARDRTHLSTSMPKTGKLGREMGHDIVIVRDMFQPCFVRSDAFSGRVEWWEGAVEDHGKVDVPDSG